MKTIIKLFILTTILLLSGQTIGQLSQNDVQAFINDHKQGTVQKIFIQKADHYSLKHEKFLTSNIIYDAKTTVMTANTTSLHIKDGNGVEAYIPYVNIKCLYYGPETDKDYSSISVIIK